MPLSTVSKTVTICFGKKKISLTHSFVRLITKKNKKKKTTQLNMTTDMINLFTVNSQDIKMFLLKFKQKKRKTSLQTCKRHREQHIKIELRNVNCQLFIQSFFFSLKTKTKFEYVLTKNQHLNKNSVK